MTTSVRPKEKLTAYIGILSPSGKLVINGKKDTFFETFPCPSSKANDEAVALKVKRHIEVFRNM